MYADWMQPAASPFRTLNHKTFAEQTFPSQQQYSRVSRQKRSFRHLVINKWLFLLSLKRMAFFPSLLFSYIFVDICREWRATVVPEPSCSWMLFIFHLIMNDIFSTPNIWVFASLVIWCDYFRCWVPLQCERAGTTSNFYLYSRSFQRFKLFRQWNSIKKF